jgi:ABC-type nitrate/sulfonate/bicarbonate transport system permease component
LLELRPGILPSPTRIVAEIWQQSGMLFTHSIPTLSSILAALLISILLGIPMALWVSNTTKIYRRAQAVLSLLLRTPMVALAPLVVVWFGFGTIPNLLIPSLVSLILLIAHLAEGRQRLPKEWITFVDATGASRSARILKVLVPATTPFLLRGLRAAVAWVIAADLVVELLGSEAGLGFLLMGATAKYDTPLIFAVFAVLTAIGAVIYLSIWATERLLVPWYREAQESDLASWSFTTG